MDRDQSWSMLVRERTEQLLINPTGRHPGDYKLMSRNEDSYEVS